MKRPSITVSNPEEGKVTKVEIIPFSSDVPAISDTLIDDIVRVCNDHGIQVVIKETEETVFVPTKKSSDAQSVGFLATARAVEARKAS